jgi:hypothetical protein
VGVTVTAPDGRVWEVKRSIRWPELRESRFGDALDIPFGDIGFDDSIIGGIVAAVVIGIIVAVVIVVLLPVFLLLVELAIAVIGSMFLRRAWVVSAETPGPPFELKAWRVRGFWRTRAAVREVADELRRGVLAEPDHAVAEL